MHRDYDDDPYAQTRTVLLTTAVTLPVRHCRR